MHLQYKLARGVPYSTVHKLPSPSGVLYVSGLEFGCHPRSAVGLDIELPQQGDS